MVNKDLLLTREELRDLRKEIVLNSLYTSDYKNTHHILPRDAQNFFDGYVEYLYELAEENGEEPDIHDLCIKYDNADNLENWYYCFDENPLLNYVEKMRPLFKKENFVLTYDKKNMIYIFSKMSPAGQDFNFEVDIGCDIEDFARNIYKTFMDYDVSYETYLRLDNTGHGKNRAPFDLEDVLEDIKACEQYIQDAHIIVCRYIDGLRR